ncbi:membrane-associated protein [Actinomycetospora cinnamomea]|uniref:Membrane-associated protein n=1 Tax=Actinomycetospora cinnamomea TaxID=663609 RepID=A0A2U1FGT0_9PSEU|nr:membrane-associated protein [Actinomycetospora cinnamomea]
MQTSVQALGPEWLDPQYIIEALGPWALAGVCLIIFAECGLLVGFFLPGDSLLFITGLAVVTGLIDTPLWLVCVLLVVCAFLGNVLGYWIGWKAGPAVFDRPNSRLFKRENVERTQKFFDKYGNRAIVLGRFVPIVRTFITVMAGVGRMDTRRYMTFSLVGGVLWAAGVTLLGAGLGQFSFVKDNIEAMLILVVLLSILPIVFEMIKARRERKLGAQGLAEDVLDGATDEPTQVIDTRRTDRR